MMSENPYTAPESDLEVVENEDNTQFYVVSIKKFTILFFITIGLYTIYWFYKNWKGYKESSGKSIWPVPRAIFNIFFVKSLFEEVQKQLKEAAKEFSWKPADLANLYIVFTVIGYVLDRLSFKEIGSPYTDLLSILMLPVVYMTLVKAQRAINLCQNDPEGESNSTYSVGNYIWILFGTIFWLLSIYGYLIIFGVASA